MILSISAFALAVALYAISQLQQQSKLRGQKAGDSFWGERSWWRKYKGLDATKEAFPGSTTIFVFLTDGYHFCQFLFTILFCISAVSYEREFGFWIGSYHFGWFIIHYKGN